MKVKACNISSASQTAAEKLLSLNRHLSELNRSKRYSDTLKLFARALRSSQNSDHYTLSAAATACANLRDDAVSGPQLHARSVRTGLKAFPRVSNALLSLYAKAGDLNSVKLVFSEIENPDVYSRTTLLSACAKLGEVELARQLFDEMPKRDVAVWNAMINGCSDEEAAIAMRYFHDMHRLGVGHDKYSFAGVLSLCSPEVMGFGREVHLLVIKTGFTGKSSVVNALIRMYFSCGVVLEAYRVFNEAKFAAVCDPITFNVVIDGMVEAGRGDEALEVFEEMRSCACLRPTEVTFASVMSSCSDSRLATELHAEAIKLGFENCTAVGNAAITMYSSCGDLCSAQRVFEMLEEKDIVSWNSMIAGYAQWNAFELAVLFFLEMQRREFTPDEFTFGRLLASSGCVNVVTMIHALVIKDGLGLRIQVSNALVSAYSKHEMMNLAYQVFEDINCKNLISWNALITGFILNGFPLQGLEQFSKLMMSEINPNVYTLVIVSSICANISALRLGKQVHSFAITSGLTRTCLGNALISMYAKGGDLDSSVKLFNAMIERDTVSYNALISAYAQHGKGEEALRCFKRMQGLSKDVKPDEATFTALLSACSHAGLVAHGARIFNQMVHNHGFTPSLDHFSCVVDLLARGGYLDEAEIVTKSERLKGNSSSNVWWGLLSACAAHGNVRLGKIVAGILLETEGHNPSVYVSLANIFAAADQWQEAAKVRNLISETGMAKQAGCSWITL